MAITKPTKPSDLLSSHFADNGVKNNFSSSIIQDGFSANYEEVLQGDNLNYMLDAIGKELDYLITVVDYLNSIGIKKVPYINSSNQLDSTDIDGLLPTQTGNSGKYLTTNGTNCLWANDFRIIGEPIITLNFNYTLPDNCVWLDGSAGENNDGVVPIDGDWAALFAIYGYQYDTSYTGQDKFRLPNFTNKVIWGGSTAGYIEAGLPNITGHSRTTWHPDGWGVGGAFTMSSSNLHAATAGNRTGTLNFNASNSNPIYGRSSTVQPPAIKARVYTRYK